MDRITKVLRKLSAAERARAAEIVERILAGNMAGMDVKKLKGFAGIYRARMGDVRIIFLKNPTVRVIAIERRNEGTYRQQV